MTITIYQKPTCTTCRLVFDALKQAGIDVRSVNYFTDPISAATLRVLLGKLGMTPRELLRTKEPLYVTLGLRDPNRTDDELIDAMAAHPELIQRPIVERGARAILARPAARLAEIL